MSEEQESGAGAGDRIRRQEAGAPPAPFLWITSLQFQGLVAVGFYMDLVTTEVCNSLRMTPKCLLLSVPKGFMRSLLSVIPLF